MRIQRAIGVVCGLGVFAGVVSMRAVDLDREPAVPMPEFYGPTQEHPFGRINPKAPAETSQFSFMVGEFDCVDRQRGSDGEWVVGRGEWNASFSMDGQAILDQFRIYETGFTTSNMRIFDERKGNWAVTWFKMPRYATVSVRGEKVGDTMVMTKGDALNGQRYVFYDIDDNGYKWKLESIRDGQVSISWETICTRRQ
jgi:hypothetical protein